jgi:glycerate kinase
VLAPDKFKGSLSAAEIVAVMQEAVRTECPGALAVAAPMADGGEGTVDAFAGAGAVLEKRVVRGPLGEPVVARFALLGRTAILEMSAASGLALLPPGRLDATRASSFGTGELIRAALDAGAQHIVVGLGGSATNDGGAGMLSALGVRMNDEGGRPVAPGGAGLLDLAAIDVSGIDPRLRQVGIEAACDVENPLCGPRGASAVFGPQKGADPPAVALLDRALARFADLTAAAVGRDVRDLPGAGAAGGLGFALAAYLGAPLRSGSEIVAGVYGLGALLDVAALCLTAEGRIDEQTAYGKTIAGVAKLAQPRGVPVVAFCGSVDRAVEQTLAERGVIAVPIVDGPMTLDAALAGARPLLAAAVRRTIRLLFSLPR